MLKRHETGFSFIELLLALTLFALIAAGVYRTFYVGTQIWSQGHSMMKETHGLRVLFNTLSQDAVNSTVFYNDDPKETLWEKRRMRFTALENIYRDEKPDTELARVEYLFDKEKGALVRKYAPVAAGSDGKAARETVFFEDLEDAAFGYASAESVPGAGLVWNEEWCEEKGRDLPRGIRVRVRFKALKGASGEQFEKIIIMPKVHFQREGTYEPL